MIHRTIVLSDIGVGLKLCYEAYPLPHSNCGVTHPNFSKVLITKKQIKDAISIIPVLIQMIDLAVKTWLGRIENLGGIELFSTKLMNMYLEVIFPTKRKVYR